MNRAIKPSSENIQEKEEDDPPDSLVLKNKISKIKLEEPLNPVRKNRLNLISIKRVEFSNRVKKVGSFFVLKERGAINIKPGFNERGIRFNLENQSFEIIYPENIWQKYPPFQKKLLSENLTFALTFHLPYFNQSNSLNYLMARPVSEPFLFKGFISALPSTALMKKESTTKLIKKLFEIDYHFIQGKNILTTNLFPRQTNKTAILPFSFGKDSLLTYSLLKELGINPIPVFVKEPLSVEENYHIEILAKKFFEEFKEKVLFIENQAGKLREAGKGWYGWELQLTQYAIMLLPIILANRARYLFFSNEQSCNEEFLDKEGFWCNPVYEQSVKWLEQMNDLFQILGIKNLEVGSLIEPLNDLAIVKILHHRYPKIAKYQTSCSAETPEAKFNRWCGNCSKCARLFIFFLANKIDPKKIGIPTNMLELKYKNKYALFEDGNNKDSAYDESRVGRDEQLLAFFLAYKNGKKGELIDLFKSLYLKEAEKREKELKEEYFGIHSTKTLPKELKDKLLNIYKEELKNLK